MQLFVFVECVCEFMRSNVPLLEVSRQGGEVAPQLPEGVSVTVH